MVNIGIKRLIFTLFGWLLIVFCIIWIIRLALGTSEFIGFSSFYEYIKTIDLWKPFRNMITLFSVEINGFNDSLNAFTQVTDIGTFFQAIGQFFVSLITLITMPVQVIFYVLQFLLTILTEILRFFTFMVGRDWQNWNI